MPFYFSVLSNCIYQLNERFGAKANISSLQIFKSFYHSRKLLNLVKVEGREMVKVPQRQGFSSQILMVLQKNIALLHKCLEKNFSICILESV